MEQPSSAPDSSAFWMIWNMSAGAFLSSYCSAIPPVKSSKPSLVEPPDRASYEPFTLQEVLKKKKYPKQTTNEVAGVFNKMFTHTRFNS